MQDLLEVDSILKSFGTRQILTDIYLKCTPGDIIGLLGRNGAGKSTLMKIIFGSMDAENKFIRINGKIMDKAFLSNQITYLPQQGFLPAGLSVRQVAELYFNKSVAAGFLEDEILAKVQTTRIRNLAGGESRYLEIKLLLYSEATFVLLDEPFNKIAPILVEKIKAMIRQQSDRKGIILTDHDYRNVQDIANKCFLMTDGGLENISDERELIRWGYLPDR